MSKTKTETPVLRNSADIPWEETRLYLPADETEEENKALYERLKKEIADGHPVDEYNNEVLCRLTPLQQKEVGIPAFYIRPVVPRLKSSDENEARLSEMAHLEDERTSCTRPKRKPVFPIRGRTSSCVLCRNMPTGRRTAPATR